MNVVLSSPAASISKENNLFKITTKEGAQLLHPKDIDSITISKSATITSDAILLAIENEIDVFFVDSLGHPIGKIWSIKYGSISTIRQKQIEFLYSPRSVQWVKELIIEKINNQITILYSLIAEPEPNPSHINLINTTVKALKEHIHQIQAIKGDLVSDIAPSLRGWEGAASRKYFQTIMHFIPEPYKTNKRTLHPPEDPFNATLSYLYGILYSRCEAALIKAGLDPYIGIFHRDNYNRPALVFDFIEKFRYWADFVCIFLFKSNAFIEECFTKENNICYLDTLGKRIVIQSLNDYLAEIITINSRERSRLTHIQEEAHKLANLFLKS